MKRNGLNGSREQAPATATGLTTTPLPSSRKVYVEGKHAGVRVPFREITLSAAAKENGHANGNGAPATMCVYDTSGPYTDPHVAINIHHGLAPLRQAWIVARGDSEELSNVSSTYGRQRAADPRLEHLRFAHIRKPRRALPGKNVSQMHYARQGIVTPEMEYIAIRENQAREETAQQAQNLAMVMRGLPNSILVIHGVPVFRR